MKHILLFLSILLFTSAMSQSGTVTKITAHQDVDLIWQGAAPFGRHDEIVSFPDDSKDYQNITMNFTIGCATSGTCSHWDYDVDMYVGEPLGIYDSNVASIDTITPSPLVLDTTWNVFEVIEWYEIGRMITPYGNYMDWGTNGFDNTWTHTFKYDVTDYEPLLHGDKPVRVHFHGWQNGFRASMDFDFTEGLPTRDVIAVQNIFDGGGYETFAQFDADNMTARTIDLPAGAEEAKMRFTVTGHGQDGEFTPIDYTVKSNGAVVREEPIWRDDCGELPLSPQGGTWVINRANWCPGDAVEIHEFELTDYIQGSGNNKTLNIDVDFDSYTPTPGSASYSVAGQLIVYDTYRRHYDIMLEDIVAPSMNENYVRFNPVCDNPVVKIKNYGKENLTYCQIAYWVHSGNIRYYDWTGDLAIGESEAVTLPLMDWSGVDMMNPTFNAKVSWPNNLVDQFVHNNELSTSFDMPMLFTTNDIKLEFRANDHPEENSYTVKNANGTTMVSVNAFAPNTINTETFNLPDGCYVLEVLDYDANWGGGDGLNWWYNTQQGLESAGWIRIKDALTNAVLNTPNPDFGSSIRLPFLVNSTLDQLPSLPTSIESSHPIVTTYTSPAGYEYSVVYDSIYINENSLFFSQEANPVGVNEVSADKLDLMIYPNPLENQFSIVVQTDKNQTVEIIITDVLGCAVKTSTITTNQTNVIQVDDLVNGVYFVKIEVAGNMLTKKIIINK